LLDPKPTEPLNPTLPETPTPSQFGLTPERVRTFTERGRLDNFGSEGSIVDSGCLLVVVSLFAIPFLV
jgi:hypothetical protein